ncbi:hypothetical protein [Streptomyces sp. NPDC052036]|uniref:hypothetical protein n=1 Tax=unclassified Streptomyces TaxID=2593676 RepID=UPI003436C1E9
MIRAPHTGGPMLHVISLIAVVVVLALYAATGVVALTTGRMLVPPWRAGVLRPRLWGCGALLFVSGMALFRFVVPGSGTTALDFVAPCGFVLLLTGGVLQMLGRRPGRVRA